MDLLGYLALMYIFSTLYFLLLTTIIQKHYDYYTCNVFPGYSNQVTQGLREGTWDTINTLKFRANAVDDGSSIRCVAEHRALKHSRMEKKIDLAVYCEFYL